MSDTTHADTTHSDRPRVLPVILAGGVGSRLWPVSRAACSKPFISLFPNDPQTLLQKTLARTAVHANQMTLVCDQESYHQYAYQSRSDTINIRYLLEPCGRNTAAAALAAALDALERYPADMPLLLLPADHLITDLPAFDAALAEALIWAERGHMVTFGIAPDRPETGYGYIEADGRRVRRFIEKPARAVAEAFLAQGGFFWNAGMFCVRIDVLLQAAAQHCPQILSAVQACMQASPLTVDDGGTRRNLNAERFAQVPDRSIDYAIMEHIADAIVVPCTIGWHDVGAWDALNPFMPADPNGNRVLGDVLLHDTQRCTVRGDQRLTALLGVADLTVIDTNDALLIAHNDRLQDVRMVYERLKQAEHPAHAQHCTVQRPWGAYTVLNTGKGFKVKRMEIKPGGMLSLQSHAQRSEHWVLVSGSVQVTLGEAVQMLNVDESIYVKVGQRHRLHNPSTVPAEIIEVQVGSVLTEDDIVRYDDVYGRNFQPTKNSPIKHSTDGL